MKKSKLSHISKDNNPSMVDISHKNKTLRQAHAQAIVILDEEVISHFEDNDIQSPKGPVFHTAIIAGTMAAKKTSDLIPFCHSIGLDDCQISLELNQHQEVVIECITKIYNKTGVEMEALCGASIAALTVYDMCKAISSNIIIKETLLLEKSGGKKDWKR